MGFHWHGNMEPDTETVTIFFISTYKHWTHHICIPFTHFILMVLLLELCVLFTCFIHVVSMWNHMYYIFIMHGYLMATMHTLCSLYIYIQLFRLVVSLTGLCLIQDFFLTTWLNHSLNELLDNDCWRSVLSFEVVTETKKHRNGSLSYSILESTHRSLLVLFSLCTV